VHDPRLHDRAATGARVGAIQHPRERAGEITVKPVSTRRELRAFIRLPWRLYAGAANWVPPLVSERKRHLDRRRNPFFAHAEAEYFLAWRGAPGRGEPVGRITAHVDHLFNEFHGNRWGMFGFFEAEDDPELAAALLDTAAGWLRERGRDRMIGPLDFSTNHECGLLVEGYEYPPQILENWHHPYYRQLFEGCGMTKAMDLYKWEILIEDYGKVYPVIGELARRVGPEHGIRLRPMRKRELKAEVRRFMEVYNEAWRHNWGFVPLTDAELDHMASELRPVLDPDFAKGAEKDGEIVGVSLSLLDYNKVLAKINGRLLPFGWVRALLARRRIDEIRVFALGVKPAYQHTGTAAALYNDVWDMCFKRGIRRAETGWILEVNEPMNRAMEALAGRIVKRYRIYERPLQSDFGRPLESEGRGSAP
jgi:GNAT superfamily N-acetyltransferase